MDFTEERIGTGEKAHIFELLNMYSNQIVLLDGYKVADGSSTTTCLKKLRVLFPKDHKIKIGCDRWTEFDNVNVRNYCEKNNIELRFTKFFWLNMFVERSF